MVDIQSLSSHFISFLIVCSIKSATGGLVRGPWGAWGSCSSDCNGKQTRIRPCDADEQETCEGQTRQTRSCSKENCLTTPIIICIVLGALILLALVLLVLVIRRKLKTRNNEKNQFDINAAEEYYDRSLRGSTSRSYFGDYPSTSRSFHGDFSSTYESSIASSRATIPTIAPYLPDLKEESDLKVNVDDTSSLGSMQFATLDFEVNDDF